MSDAMYDPIRMFTEVVENLWRPMFIVNFLVLVVWAICRVGERRLPASLRCYLWRLTYVKLLLTATIGVVFCGGFPLELPPLPAHEITAMAGPPPDVIAAEPQLKSAPSTTYRIAPEPHSFLWLLHQAVCPEGVKVLSDGSGWTTDMDLTPTGSTLLTWRKRRQCSTWAAHSCFLSGSVDPGDGRNALPTRPSL